MSLNVEHAEAMQRGGDMSEKFFTYALELVYPNGRSHVCVVSLPQELEAGSQFELYGRVWRVKRRRPARLSAPPGQVVCEAVSRAPAARTAAAAVTN